ncbi:MAG: hypothetical protein ABGY41_22645 [Candidatus Poribacteria bacterium]
MLKLASLSSLLAVSLVFAGSATAQLRRLPGIPLMSPVNHPALVGQTLIGNETTKSRPRGVKVKAAPKKVVKPDPSTSGVKLKGKALKNAVKKVKALPWSKKLSIAKSRAKKSGKPILLLQTLGDIDGFA